ncbi:uncharacterized protein EKO05_0010457 [Ascochyta rabiei]|uniref:Uncharacterized protein n=1 Tax=Didymella rabiei TaxID=5454 RepID=A0A163M2L4_DIDRA|nr:uncharacterized protein EKO05_0010457 [Ascochyta rabiei]KZM28345.1 hypothetical protein ST47_g520 [Ascochyta rabiei]UPX20217.1 hypothetical protein EKO05_0010457 [Ascochyta rabiei]
MAAVSSTTVIQNDGSRSQRVDPGLLTVLADYDIHQSTPGPNDTEGDILVGGHTLRQRQPDDFDPTLAAHPTVPYAVSNPPWWDNINRRVPPYRPANRELDMEERRQNPVFQLVGRIMITGCMTIASASWAWRNTVGRYTDIGLNKVGGEW